MINFKTAQKIISKNISVLKNPVTVKVTDSLGYVTSEDIKSGTDLPPFNQSNVDGYAVADSGSGQWSIVSEIRAGDHPDFRLKKGEAARVFTGAELPAGTYSVMMQEKVITKGDKLYCHGEKIVCGNFIRKRGAQIKKGATALRRGTLINPAVIGFLLSMGIKYVKVYRKPVLSLIVTGDELQEAGAELKEGKVYESNLGLLRGLAVYNGFEIRYTSAARDRKADLKSKVKILLKKSDLLLVSGGVSVGKYDYVNQVLEELNVSKLFYKVSQKPGKPLYFGIKSNSAVFGLPGNPASAFTCFYLYVLPVLKKMSGHKKYLPVWKKLPVKKDIIKEFNLSWFLRAKYSDDNVMPLDAQASFMLRTLTEANCFIHMPSNKNKIVKGEFADVCIF
ncbi:MAG TPA: molybdopterin molybdotransferase MoeA [Ignavibacteria bacterium]|nr:molybdopterin molybdenumtransferase MoeA [Bacteroidota bacterium]HRI84655.1 molybdopterin molybdotransferase MoeA [Ignavibacteria bacterium]HRJ99259.1 molybdopterin molybdotransferase MoeA [Ignavibacteria bacterium]